MPISNGDACGSPSTKGEFQDYTKALAILEKEYPIRDGLDVDILLDSDKHGALTYNDFLILPGYIGATSSIKNGPSVSILISPPRVPCVGCQS
jgi:IMP dehydrogenase